ncbi:NnrU family protein [Novosphingobium acidiphilum]|uniref:NnrU family protein n=1 Tax=Novosphingobium acidiphilum TaxID=505248 RepID=UPI0003F4EA82|nr:NnrU family protein [Novosphingobium acidiphilum]
MAWLIAGLVLFLGAHSVQIFAGGWRARAIARLGKGPWMGLYTLVSLAGLVLIGHGYGLTRGAAPLWMPPKGSAHATFGLVWLAFILVVAAYWPGNHIKHWLRDPMVAGVGLWALGHLLVNATPAALLLFGGFLAWAIIDFVSLRLRGSSRGAAPKAINTVLVVITGTVLAWVFAHVLHLWLIGVSPFATM